MKEDFPFTRKISIELLENLAKEAGLALDKDKEWDSGQDNYRIFTIDKRPVILGRVYCTQDGKNVRSVQINYQRGLPSEVYQSIFSFYGALYENNIHRKVVLPDKVNGPDGT